MGNSNMADKSDKEECLFQQGISPNIFPCQSFLTLPQETGELILAKEIVNEKRNLQIP